MTIDEQIMFLLQSVESLNSNMDRLVEQVSKGEERGKLTDERLDKLAAANRQNSEHINALVRIVEIHEQ